MGPSRVRVAEVALLRADPPRERVTATPLVLVRMEDCLSTGVQDLWLVDPLQRGAYTVNREGLHIAIPRGYRLRVHRLWRISRERSPPSTEDTAAALARGRNL